jgi:hypothetical protein
MKLKAPGPALKATSTAPTLKKAEGLSLTGAFGAGKIAEVAPPQSLDELEQQDAAKMAQVYDALTDIKKSAGKELDRFRVSVDTGFWFAVAFQSREAKDEFLRLMGWVDLGDKYLCGEDVAKRLKVTLETPLPDIPKWTTSKRLVALSSPMTDEE